MHVSHFRPFAFTAARPEVCVSRINTAHLSPLEGPRSRGDARIRLQTLQQPQFGCKIHGLLSSRVAQDADIVTQIAQLSCYLFTLMLCYAFSALTDRKHLGRVIVIEVSELEYTCKYTDPLDKCQYL